MWIIVDWGDKSGEVIWYIEDMKDVWSHVYAAQGLTTNARFIFILFVKIQSFIGQRRANQ